MKIERSTAEDISDISARLYTIESSVMEIQLEVSNLSEPLVRSDGVPQSIPDGIENLSGHLFQMRLESIEFKRLFALVIWILIVIAATLGLLLWRVW